MKSVIASPDNKFLKEASRLRGAKYRRKSDKFVLEGAAYIADIPENMGSEVSLVEYLLVCESQYDIHRDLCQKHNYRVVADRLLESVSDTVTPQGIIAVCRRPRHNAKALAEAGGLYIICEDVRDPGNFGTIIRTAAAAGVSAVFALPGCVDAYSPKVVRASSGALFAIPVIEDIGVTAVLDLLRQNHTSIYATHLEGSILPYDADLRGNCAIIIGNEAQGISQNLADQCDYWLKLPMPGAVQSLNASVAAGIIIYESLRQRL